MADSKKNPLDEVGHVVRANVKRLRAARRLTYKELCDRLTAYGRAIPVLGLSRIERGERRVDADDLVALAVALEVSPLSLLLPHEPTGEGVQLAPEIKVSWQGAWRWASGEQPLILQPEPLDVRDPRVTQFIAENRPYEDESYMREVTRALIARTPAPFKAIVQFDGEHTWTQLLHGDVDDDGQRQ